jgi:hypothetical protein
MGSRALEGKVKIDGGNVFSSSKYSQNMIYFYSKIDNIITSG